MLKAILIPVQVIVGLKCCKVISLYNDCGVTDFVIENTGVGGSSHKPSMFHRLCVGIFPQLSSVASPIDTSHLSGHEIWAESYLLRKLHINRPLRNSVKVRFTNVDK